MRKQWDNLIIRDNCHPLKTIIVLWGQIPLWIVQSMALRNLLNMLPDPSLLKAKLVYTELTLGGFGFIPNLTETDSSLIIPVTLGLLNLAIIEVGFSFTIYTDELHYKSSLYIFQIQSMGKANPSKYQKYATIFFRTLSLVMVPIAATVPAVRKTQLLKN